MFMFRHPFLFYKLTLDLWFNIRIPAKFICITGNNVGMFTVLLWKESYLSPNLNFVLSDSKYELRLNA